MKQETPVRIPTATPYIYPESIPKQIDSALATPAADVLTLPHASTDKQEVLIYKGVGTVANAGRGQFTKVAPQLEPKTIVEKQDHEVITHTSEVLNTVQAQSVNNTKTLTSYNHLLSDENDKINIIKNRTMTQGRTITKNTADIQQNTNDIKDLRSDFKEMGKRVDGTAAMGMATSSLFQPYGVGKANVTMGLGNYNGANAVAFGSGIRIDEHVALRANVAYVDSTNDTGFGVGASYEW